MKVAVIGAGAAGCFCAIQLRRSMPDASVDVYEAGRKPLAKVAITGGGRCNLTNSFDGVVNMAEVYPRGTQLMKRALKHFSPQDTWRWFESEGVALVLQDDRCVFPASQDALEITGTLMRLMRQTGVSVHTGCRVSSIVPPSGECRRFSISFVREDGSEAVASADAVVVTTGGSPKASGISFLSPLNLELVPPVPSLFTFRVDDTGIKALMGNVVDKVTLSIPGTKMKASGTLLLTDWGFSGPAALKLSSYAARYLSERSYNSPVAVNWLGDANEQDARGMLQGIISSSGKKMITGARPDCLTSRLWEHLLSRAGLRTDMRWGELGSKGFNKLVSTLACDCYRICGRAAFKEEFVTCGGVSLDNIDINTLECKKHPGLYFAGEVLDVDAVTGGFNLQAAWSTAYICAESISRL